MRKRAWLSAVLFFGLLSPVVLQSNVCGPVEYSKLERLELWVAGQNEIAAFDSAQLAYEASAPSAEMTATLVFEARDPSATVTVSPG